VKISIIRADNDQLLQEGERVEVIEIQPERNIKKGLDLLFETIFAIRHKQDDCEYHYAA
jgi:hypothetical protein